MTKPDDAVVLDLLKLGQRNFLFAAPCHGMDLLVRFDPSISGGWYTFNGLSRKWVPRYISMIGGEIVGWKVPEVDDDLDEWWMRVAADYIMCSPPLDEKNLIDFLEADSGQWLLSEEQLHAALPRFETFDEDISDIIGYYRPQFELVSSKRVTLDGRRFIACAIVDTTHSSWGWDWAPLGAPQRWTRKRSKHPYVFYDFLLPWSKDKNLNSRTVVEAQQFVRILHGETRFDWFTRMHELFTVRSCGEILNLADK
ncbi:hypothetical protein [Jonesia quinghaiensis]|uniref:hypothetical protein n=1 Tax=Jonesia quinghaiensis TaxID=262806 RepID=UPI000491A093|nr:hypothetical protein [Jonesia quinghaiensis]